jgi:hypothetical protein
MLRKQHAVAISGIHLSDQWFAGFWWGKIGEKRRYLLQRVLRGRNPYQLEKSRHIAMIGPQRWQLILGLNVLRENSI